MARGVYKDYLCQLLSLDLYRFDGYHHLLFCSVGYTYNKSPYYPYIRFEGNQHLLLKSEGYSFDKNPFNPLSEGYLYVQSAEAGLYSEKCLQNKTIVHIYMPSDININHWFDVFNIFPDVFFSFTNLAFDRKSFIDDDKKDIDESFKFSKKVLLREIDTEYYFKNVCVAVPDNWACEILDDNRFKKDYSSDGNSITRINNYHIIGNDLSRRNLASNIIEAIHRMDASKSPYSLIIHDTGKPISEHEIENIFNEPAIDYMIVPYDERDRRSKYAKIYDEFSEEIEKYKRLYNIKDRDN